AVLTEQCENERIEIPDRVMSYRLAPAPTAHAEFLDLSLKRDARDAERAGRARHVTPIFCECFCDVTRLEVGARITQRSTADAWRFGVNSGLRTRVIRRSPQLVGKVLALYGLTAGGEHNGAFDLVLEFADVAGPVIALKQLQRGRIELPNPFLLA